MKKEIKEKKFDSALDALDFIDKLNTKKIKGILNVIIKNAVYHERFKYLLSADISWKVTYKRPCSSIE